MKEIAVAQSLIDGVCALMEYEKPLEAYPEG